MDSVLKYSSTGLQWCQITWHTENMSVSPLTYCPPTVLPALSWYISCIVTRRQNIRGAGIPVPNPVLSPAWKCPWETAVPDEIGTGLDWWQGSLVFQDLEGCWLLPKHWSHGWEKWSFVVEPRKTFVDPKDPTDMNNEAAEMGKEMRNTCAIQYINVMCSAFFLPFFWYCLITASLTCWGKYS